MAVTKTDKHYFAILKLLNVTIFDWLLLQTGSKITLSDWLLVKTVFDF